MFNQASRLLPAQASAIAPCWVFSSDTGPNSAFWDRVNALPVGERFKALRASPDYESLKPAQRKIIDNEIRDIVTRNYNRIKKLIEENKDKLEAIAEALLERETVDGDEIRRLVFGDSQTKEAPTKEEEEPSSAGGGE